MEGSGLQLGLALNNRGRRWLRLALALNIISGGRCLHVGLALNISGRHVGMALNIIGGGRLLLGLALNNSGGRGIRVGLALNIIRVKGGGYTRCCPQRKRNRVHSIHTRENRPSNLLLPSKTGLGWHELTKNNRNIFSHLQ